MKLASRIEHVTYAIRDVAVAAEALERKGRKILKLNIGDPDAYDFDTPEYIRKAMGEAVEKRLNGYGDSQGLARLREAVVKENRRNGIRCAPGDVVVSAGVSEAVQMLCGALLDPRDEVLVPSPGYPQYESLVNYHGAVPRFYELVEEKGFAPDLSQLEGTDMRRAKALVIINPHNPTGGVLEKKQLAGLLEFAAEHKLVVFSDEIYSELVFDAKHTAAASLARDVPVVTLSGMSKNNLAPGWRVGWMTFTGFEDSGLKEAVLQLCRLRLCANMPAQYAAAVGLEHEKDNRAAYGETLRKLRRRRDLAFKRLNEMPGLSCVKPEGAFYAFPRIDDHRKAWKNDRQFADELLREESVLTVFGAGFAEKQGTKHFRIVFLPPEEVLEEAFARIERFMRKRRF